MKQSLLVLLMPILASAPAFASSSKMNTKCSDLVKINDQFIPEYMAIYDGYSKSGKRTGETVDIGGIVAESDQVKKECQNNGKQTVAAALNTVTQTRNGETKMQSGDATQAAPSPSSTKLAALVGPQGTTGATTPAANETKSTKTAKINPVDAKCSEFLELDEQYMPVAAYWVAGHSKNGKATKGHMDEEFLTRPVAMLVQECKAHPTASFYSRAKTWISKKI